MITYWTMYAFPAFFALVSGGRKRALNALDIGGLILVFLMFAILIGFRFEVGADWFTYENIVNQIALEDVWSAISYGDPGFTLVAWLSTRVGADIYGANLVCGAALVTGLIAFCRRQDHVWLAIAAAVPYLLIVVGMGYVRQGAAIGFILIALTCFERAQFARTIVWVFVAGLFHATAVCIAPLIGLATVRRRPILIIPGAIVSFALFVFLLQDRLDVFYSNYIEAEYDSSGAMVRLLMNAAPALLFLRYRKNFDASAHARVLYLLLSVLALVLVVAVALSPSSTLIDRIGLYLIPLQVYVFGNLANAMRLADRGRIAVSVLTVGYYAAILFVWLNFAVHAELWVPYRFMPLEV